MGKNDVRSGYVSCQLPRGMGNVIIDILRGVRFYLFFNGELSQPLVCMFRVSVKLYTLFKRSGVFAKGFSNEGKSFKSI